HAGAALIGLRVGDGPPAALHVQRLEVDDVRQRARARSEQVDGVGADAAVDPADDAGAAIQIDRVVAAFHADGAAGIADDHAVVGEDVLALAGLDRRAVATNEAG